MAEEIDKKSQEETPDTAQQSTPKSASVPVVEPVPAPAPAPQPDQTPTSQPVSAPAPQPAPQPAPAQAPQVESQPAPQQAPQSQPAPAQPQGYQQPQSAMPQQPGSQPNQTVYQQQSQPEVPAPNMVPTLILGIIAILGALFIPLVGVISGIAAIVLARKDQQIYGPASKAKPGKVMGIIGLVLSLVVWLANFVLLIGMI